MNKHDCVVCFSHGLNVPLALRGHGHQDGERGQPPDPGKEDLLNALTCNHLVQESSVIPQVLSILPATCL